LIAILLTPFVSNGQQKWSYGGNVDYNFSTKGFGLGARASYKITNRISANPQIQYFPILNSIHESYLGANLHYAIIKSEKEHPDTHILKPSNTKVEVYAIAGAAFNYWFNASSFPQGNRNTIIPLVGIGASKGKPEKRYFIEAKYNLLWNEPTVSIGLLLSPKKTQSNSNPCFNN
jgi:hypothetical protein